MKLMIKTFPELTGRELYEILRLRSEVFIVEQKGCYQDLDQVDYDSIHIFLWDEAGSAEGCVRIFPRPGHPHTVQIGRLAVRSRRAGHGTRLMEQARLLAAERYGARFLFLEGRRSAREFYQALGYRPSLPSCFSSEEEAAYFEFSRRI